MTINENDKNIEKEETTELPFCQVTETAEQSRLWEDNDPCDPGIRGKI